MQALINVADHAGLHDLAQELHALHVTLFTTQSTASMLTHADIPVHTLEELFQKPDAVHESTQLVHPSLIAAILTRTEVVAQVQELKRMHISPIEVVVVNFSAHLPAYLSIQPQSEILSQIDIGRLTLVEAAARNYQHVLVLVDPQDYVPVMQEWHEQGEVSQETRRRLAVKAWRLLAMYTSSIAEYLTDSEGERFPPTMTLSLERALSLRQGENPHQQAALYRWSTPWLASSPSLPSVASAQMVHGKSISYTNLLDLDAALNAVSHFTAPAIAIMKHRNPGGLACDEELVEAYRKAHAGSPVSSAGGVVGSNRPIDEATAHEVSQLFFDAIIAPDYHPAALRILRQRQSLCVLTTMQPLDARLAHVRLLLQGRPEVRSLSGGLLLQTPDVFTDNTIEYRVVTDREPTLEETTDLMFAWKAVRCVTSIAVVFAHKLMLVGTGAGQTHHVESVNIALSQAGERARGAVMAADDAFPFHEGVEMAARAGVTAIIQPGGSVHDEEVIRAANQYAVAMVFTGQRHSRY